MRNEIIGRWSAISIAARIASSLLLALGLGGCDCSGGTIGQPCDTEGECAAGQTCTDGLCRARPELDGAVGDSGGARMDSGGGRDSDIPAPDAGPCRSVSSESGLESVPVDIIIAIDNSGSMTEEAIEVQRNINEFARIIGESGLDYRVVLISRKDTTNNGVCVPEPLGSGPPACESGPEGRLLALDIAVASRNAPNLVLSSYPMYRDFLRMEAAKVFIWITDDESGTYNADQFRAELDRLEPAGMFARTTHNAIVGYYGDAPADWSRSSTGSCGSLARVGAIYLRLANCLRNDNTLIEDCTPGLQARVCETDWTPIFTDIARGVVEGVPVVCEFEVPAAPEGFTLDLDMVRVTWRSGDVVRMPLNRVTAVETCTDDGWYFDDPIAPTQIILCPALCTMVQMDADARMDVALGCFPLLM